MSIQRGFQAYADHTDRTIFAPNATIQDDQLFSASLASITAHVSTLCHSTQAASGRAYQSSCGFIEHGLPNAFADEWNGQYMAGIHAGLAVTIHEFSLFCFAQSSFLPMIGVPTKEVSPKATEGIPPGVALLIASIKAEKEQPFLDRFVMPQCEHRTAAAHYLSLLMMRYVWLHETAHGVLGHIDYLRSQDALDPIGIDELHFDVPMSPNTTIDNRILQCMEFEADGWALAKLIAIQMQSDENIPGVASLHLALRLQMSLIAGFSLCWLMETLSSTAKRGRLNITHPAPIRRLHHLQNIAANELGVIKMDSAAMLKHVSTQVGGVLNQIGGQWLQTDKFDPVIYRSVFDQLREDLDPYRNLIRE